MKRLLCSLVAFAGLLVAARAADPVATASVYELRIYTTHPGKMPDLLKRFREHTCTIFAKHGMENVGYWLPVDTADGDKLYYFLKHQSRDAAKASWQAFKDDPEWKAVATASEANGKIVAKVESVYLSLADYSPPLPKLSGTHVFELRTYVTNEGKLDALDKRFREHTLALFTRHGMTNLPYWHPTDADKGAGNTLIYLLAHDSQESAKKSWDAFRSDPEWIAVRDASEKDGKILTASPKSVYLTPTDFSAIK